MSFWATATVAAVYSAEIYLLDLRQIYDGAAKPVTATTMPAGLTVTFTYNGLSTAPTATGTYAVVGTVNDGEYYATATGTLQILVPWDYQHVNFGDGWLWSGDGIYPFLYREEDETWLWYDGGTNPRRFFNFTTELWEERP